VIVVKHFGETDFVLQRGYAEIALAASASGPEKDGLLKAAYLDGFNVWYWEQGQTRTGAQALHVLQRSHRQDFGPHPDPYAYDYPMRTYYPYWDSEERLVRIALENSCFDLRPATHLAWLLGKEQNRWDQVDELLKSLEGRFNGSPERISLMASALARKGDYKGLEQQYAEGIRLQPKAEELYTELGKLLFRNGETDRSAKVFMSFPGLKDLKTNEIVYYLLVSPEEADFERNKISVTSPLGRGLMGKTAGQRTKITVPAGTLEYEILDISR